MEAETLLMKVFLKILEDSMSTHNKKIKMTASLSIVAHTATLLGAGIAGYSTAMSSDDYLNTSDVDFDEIVFTEGTGGGSAGDDSLEPGGTHSITIVGSTTTNRVDFTLSYTVTCPADNYINCTAFLFNGDNMLAEVSFQGTCAAAGTSASFASSFRRRASTCGAGDTAQVNWSCVNQDTNSVLNWDTGSSGQASSIDC